MAGTWLAITVELLGGRGRDLRPPPGRVFAVGPSHTFTQFAEAINTAFARWDMAHISEFTLADGVSITDPAIGLELMESGVGPVQLLMDIERTKVAKTVGPGEEFRFVFDLGDGWVHRCEVHEAKVDPVEVLGIRPKTPLAYWGWGDMPDQYGRRTADGGDDDDEAYPARDPEQSHPMQGHRWPPAPPLTRTELAEVRRAIAARDVDAMLTAITGRQIDDALQQIAVGAPLLLQYDDAKMPAMVLSFVNRLKWRALPGDAELSEDLLALLRGEAPAGREVPIDIDRLASDLNPDVDFMTGAYVDLETGSVFPLDDGFSDLDHGVDFEAEPDRYLWLDRSATRDHWSDRMAFAAQQRDHELRLRLETALDGTDAFQAFRTAVNEAGLDERWRVFSMDMAWGRARARLTESGVRVVLP